MITLNPYENVNFSSCIKLVSNTHEHIMNQSTLESCYNRGVRNINLLHYSPSAPQKFDINYQTEYEDYTSTNDLTKITKLSPKRSYSDFTDKDGNQVNLSDIVVIPNCEHVNIIGYPYMLHSNYLGSEFSDPGWLKQTGDTQSGVTWRKEHPIITEYELFDSVRANLPFNKVFGTLNHPTDSISSYSITNQFIERSNGLIKAVEIFSRGYSSNKNQTFEDYYDYLLNNEHQLWGVAVVDWQNDGTQYYPNDLGANVLLLPHNYNTLSYVEKQNAILDSYINGEYFPVGWGTLMITNIEQNNNYINFTFNKSANKIYGIFDGNKKLLGSNIDYISIDTNNAEKFFRLKAIGEGDEFIFSQPIFVNNIIRKRRNTYKVLF